MMADLYSRNTWQCRIKDYCTVLYQIYMLCLVGQLAPHWETHERTMSLKITLVRALICTMWIKSPQNVHKIPLMYFLWYFHLHVSAANPAIFRLKFLLQEFSVIKNINLLHIWISILWSNLTHFITLYSCKRNFNLTMAGLAAKTCSWKYHNQNTSLELNAFCGFLIQTMQQ
jgi:hypothetical protein